MSKNFRNRNSPVQKTQTVFDDPWLEPETRFAPKVVSIPLERNLLESDPSLAHEALAQAGSPSAKALGGGEDVAILHPVQKLLEDELKIKTAFRSSLGQHTRNAMALMIWFPSPIFC
jgi:hypothetical protein